MKGQAWRWLHDAHRFWLAAALIYAVAHLGMLRNGDLRPVLLFLVPPLFAFGILASPKATPPARFAAQLFLAHVAIAIILAEQPFILQNMKPHFPDVPKAQDRVLTLYEGAYLLFIMGVLPAFACGFHGELKGFDQAGAGSFGSLPLMASCAAIVEPEHAAPTVDRRQGPSSSRDDFRCRQSANQCVVFR